MPAGMSPDLVPSRKSAASAAVGRQLFEERGCFACHGKEGTGGAIAPALAPLLAKVSDPQLIGLLENPSPKMKAGGMPPVAATPEQIGALVAYLRSLRMPEPPRSPIARNCRRTGFSRNRLATL